MSAADVANLVSARARPRRAAGGWRSSSSRLPRRDARPMRASRTPSRASHRVAAATIHDLREGDTRRGGRTLRCRKVALGPPPGPRSRRWSARACQVGRPLRHSLRGDPRAPRRHRSMARVEWSPSSPSSLPIMKPGVLRFAPDVADVDIRLPRRPRSRCAAARGRRARSTPAAPRRCCRASPAGHAAHRVHATFPENPHAVRETLLPSWSRSCAAGPAKESAVEGQPLEGQRPREGERDLKIA